MAKLFITLADAGQVTHQLVGDVITVGRNPDNMIQIDHDSVSGHHARLVVRNDRYHLQDLNPSPRSYINGMPSSESDLPGSCVLRFGTVECIYKDERNSSTIDQYVVRLAEAQRQVEAVIRARDAMHQQVQDLQKQKEAAEQAKEDIAMELEDLRRQFAGVEAQTVGAVGQAHLHNGQNGHGAPEGLNGNGENAVAAPSEGERQELETLNARLKEAAEKIATIETERDGIQQGAEVMSKALFDAKQQIEGARRERDAAKKQFQEAEAALEEQRKQNAQLAGQSNGEEPHGQDAGAHPEPSEAMAEAQRRIEAISAERDSALSRESETARLLEEERGKSAAAGNSEELDNLRRQLEAAAAERDTARQEKDEQARKLEEQQAELLALRERAAHREGDSNEPGEAPVGPWGSGGPQVEQNRFEIAKLAGERDALHRRNVELTACVDELRDQLESLNRTRGATKQEADAIRMDRDSLKEQQAEWVARLESMRNQVGPLTEERNQARSAGEKAGVMLAETAEKLRAVTAERDAALRQAEAAEEKLKAADQPVEQAPVDSEKAYEQFKKALAEKENEVSRLQEELKAARSVKVHAPPVPRVPQMPLPRPPQAHPVEKPAAADKPAAAAEKHPAATEKHAEEPRQPKPVVKSSQPPTLRSSLAAIRNRLQYFIRHPDEHAVIDELAQHTSDAKNLSAGPGLEMTNRLSGVMDGMVADLVQRPALASPSLLRSLSQAVDFLLTLQEEKNAAKAGGLSPGKVLVVDDDPGILSAIVPSLERASLKVTTCNDAQSALDMLGDQNPDLILLDVGLPDMNGMDLCAKIREMPAHKKTPIFFLTGLDTVQNRVDSMLSGGNDFIGKPFNSWELGAKALIWALKGQLALV